MRDALADLSSRTSVCPNASSLGISPLLWTRSEDVLIMGGLRYLLRDLVRAVFMRFRVGVWHVADVFEGFEV